MASTARKRATVSGNMGESASAAVLGRVPPHNVDAEEGLLACCVLDGGADILTACLESRFRPEAFFCSRQPGDFSGSAGSVQRKYPAYRSGARGQTAFAGGAEHPMAQVQSLSGGSGDNPAGVCRRDLDRDPDPGAN